MERSMQQADYDEFARLIDDAYDMISVGTKSLSAAARAMFFRAVARYPLDVFRAALHAHIMGKEGRFVPQPSHINEQVELMVAHDTRPDPEEAWAIALTGQDEACTVVWTQEAAEAFAICQPVLSSSGAISARKPFLAAYARLVAEARAARRPAQWVTSIGFDKSHQVSAIRAAVNKGLLPAPAAAALLEGPATDPTPDRKARAQLLRIKRMMKVAAGRKEQRLAAEAEARAQAEADWKRKTNETVQVEMNRQRGIV